MRGRDGKIGTGSNLCHVHTSAVVMNHSESGNKSDSMRVNMVKGKNK